MEKQASASFNTRKSKKIIYFIFSSIILIILTVIFFKIIILKGKYEEFKIVGKWDCYQYAISSGKIDDFETPITSDATKYNLELKSNGHFKDNAKAIPNDWTEDEWKPIVFDEIMLTYKNNENVKFEFKYKIISISENELILGYIGVPGNKYVMVKQYYKRN